VQLKIVVMAGLDPPLSGSEAGRGQSRLVLYQPPLSSTRHARTWIRASAWKRQGVGRIADADGRVKPGHDAEEGRKPLNRARRTKVRMRQRIPA